METRGIPLSIALFAVSFCALAQHQRPESRVATVVTLKGTPFQRGLSHGRTLRQEIHRALGLWKANLTRTYKMNADEFIHRFARKTDYQAAIREWTPGLLEEVRGIAEGAGVDFETMFVYQLTDEYWVNGEAITANEHCSGVGVAATGQHPAIVAQNMDLEGFLDGFATILRIQEENGLEALVLTQPGLIALNGMNNRGIGVTVNTVSQLAHARTGLPVTFVIRGILESASREEADSFVRHVPHASGQNYIIGSPAGVVDYEASSGKVVVAPARGAFVCHTNHPLANEDYSEEYHRAGTPSESTDNSHTRLSALDKRFSTDAGAGTIEQVQAALRSRDSELNPVSRHCAATEPWCTFASVVMVLGPRPYLLVAPGAPDMYSYQMVSFAGH